MSTHSTPPFSSPELAIRWARNTIRACALLKRLLYPGVDIPLLDALAQTAREVLNGAIAEPVNCAELTAGAWALVEHQWYSLTHDPFGVRRRLFAPYADASATAAADWRRHLHAQTTSDVVATPSTPKENPAMATVHRLPHRPRHDDGSTLTIREHLHRVIDTDADVPESAHASIDAARVRRLVKALPALERRVITWRYGLDGRELSLRAIASRLGISRHAASAIHERALQLLRAEGEPELMAA